MIDYRMSMNHRTYVYEVYQRITIITLEEAFILIGQWKPRYNRTRLHDSPGYQSTATKVTKSEIINRYMILLPGQSIHIPQGKQPEKGIPEMIEIIFHGRGGQGAVVAAQILATAAFLDGKYSHTLPYFRAERKGAPVIAYTRISDEPIELRGGVEKADMILILDAALLKAVNPLASLKSKGLAIINTTLTDGEILDFSTDKDIKIGTIDATTLSEKLYGQSSIPRVNMAMLGYFAALTGTVTTESVLSGIDIFFTGDNAVKAKEGVKLAYDTVPTIVTSKVMRQQPLDIF